MRSKSCCLLKLKLFLPSASAPLFGRSSASGSLSSLMSQPCHCGKMKRFAERGARLWKTWLFVNLPKVPRLPPTGIVCWKCEVAYGEMSAAVSGIFSTWQLQWGTRDGDLVFMFFCDSCLLAACIKTQSGSRRSNQQMKRQSLRSFS